MLDIIMLKIYRIYVIMLNFKIMSVKRNTTFNLYVHGWLHIDQKENN